MGKATNDPDIVNISIQQVNDDLFTNQIFPLIGPLCCITIQIDGSVLFDLPESIVDLVIYDSDSGEWAPVVGAFTDSDHLYLIMAARSDLYIYSPTAPLDHIVKYLDNDDYQSDEYYVNRLNVDCIAEIRPIA
jgi:hypothetical protein